MWILSFPSPLATWRYLEPLELRQHPRNTNTGTSSSQIKQIKDTGQTVPGKAVGAVPPAAPGTLSSFWGLEWQGQHSCTDCTSPPDTAWEPHPLSLLFTPRHSQSLQASLGSTVEMRFLLPTQNFLLCQDVCQGYYSSNVTKEQLWKLSLDCLSKVL